MVEPLACDVLLIKQLRRAGSTAAIQLLIQQFEAGLASGSQWSHDRINYLKGLSPDAAEVSDDCYLAGIFRTSESQLARIAQRGMSALFNAGEITSIEVGGIADDVASLLKLNDELLTAKGDGKLAPVWEHVFDLPEGFPSLNIDFPSVYSRESSKG